MQCTQDVELSPLHLYHHHLPMTSLRHLVVPPILLSIRRFLSFLAAHHCHHPAVNAAVNRRQPSVDRPAGGAPLARSKWNFCEQFLRFRQWLDFRRRAARRSREIAYEMRWTDDGPPATRVWSVSLCVCFSFVLAFSLSLSSSLLLQCSVV